MAHPPIEWAGVGETGKIFQTESHERYVDPGWGNETVDVSTEWTLAEFKSCELYTDAVLEVTRTIKMRTADGVSILIRSRGRTFFFADKLPNDVHAAVYAPAKSIKHDGVIQVTAGDTVRALRTMDHKRDPLSSLGDMLAIEPMLGFDVEPRERLRQSGYFLRRLLPRYEGNLEWIDSIMSRMPHAMASAKEYIRQKLDYRTPDEDLLRTGDFLLEGMRELMVYSWTGYESSDVYDRLEELRDKLQGLLNYAREVKPAAKDGWDHALDLGKAVVKAVVGLGVAVKELGAMARDVTMKGADAVAGVFGYEIEWKAWSAIGKAYESGKTTKEIFTSIVDGIIDQWSMAIDKASNGDYSGIMDLSAELILDIGIELISMGAATPAVAAKRMSTASRFATFTKEAAEATTKRAKDLLRKSKALMEEVPAHARRKLQDTIDGLEALVYAHAHNMVAVGGGRFGLNGDAIPQALTRIRGARAMEAAERAVGRLRGAAKRTGTSVLGRLEKLATKMPGAVHSLAARIAKPGSAKLVKALDDALRTWVNKLDDDVSAAALRRAADAVDPVAYVDNINWVMKRDGINLAARKELVRQAVMRKGSLDLGWLRTTELDAKTLDFLAMDPATNWRTFMRVSEKASDYFPSSVKKHLEPKHYAEAGAKLRGVAGELMFVVNKVPLPDGMKIVARQLDMAGKKIDFGLENAAGHPAMLEMKAWNAAKWEKEMRSVGTRMQLTDDADRLVKQLAAAKREAARRFDEASRAARAGDTLKGPATIYLGTTDVISAADEFKLRKLLADYDLGDVKVVKFPETSLATTRNKLRDALGIGTAGAATAVLAADSLADYADERDP
jgi:hypothetical protein